MVDFRDVIVSKTAVHGLCYANCIPFLVIVKYHMPLFSTMNMSCQ